MKRKNSPLSWIIPALASIAIIYAFIYMRPIKKILDHTSTYFTNSQNINIPTKTPPNYKQTNHPQIYRWTDENGKTHYGDNPPPNTIVEIVDPENANVTMVDMTPAPKYQPSQPPQVQPIQKQKRTATSNQTSLTTQHRQCEQVKKTIEQIDMRMRAGYKAWEGERLRKRRHELVKQRNQYCH